jgi:uncharacterized protein YndB with AHSA1/START domain
MNITVEVVIAAPIKTVWQLYTTPSDIKRWNSAAVDWHTTMAEVDLREGGRFCSRMEAKNGSAGFDFEGIYTRIVINHLIEYEFGGRRAAVSFREVPEGISVSVTVECETADFADQQRADWQSILNNFASYVAANI